jgi:hypothetical protein
MVKNWALAKWIEPQNGRKGSRNPLKAEIDTKTSWILQNVHLIFVWHF